MNFLSDNSITKRKKSVELLLKKARREERLGKFHDAAEIYQDILSKFPGNKSAHDAIIKLRLLNPIPDLRPLIESNRFDEAENILISNIERDKLNPNFWKLLGVVYHGMKNHSLSLQCYQKALELDPNDYELIYQVGCDLIELNDLGNAYKAFRHVLALKPETAGAHTNIGAIYDKIKNFEKAKTEWLKAIEVDPKESVALSYLGCFEAEHGDHKLALAYFNKALKYRPDDVNAYVNVATALYEAGKTSEALQIYETWQKRNWDNIGKDKENDYNLNYSLALFTDGQVDRAWSLYRNRIYCENITPLDVTKIKFPRLEAITQAKNKSILVIFEQGIGDQIRFLGLLDNFQRTSNCEIILLVEPRLESLLKRSFASFKVISDPNSLENYKYDYWMLYGDMGELLSFNKSNKNLSAPYINVSRKHMNYWKNKLCSSKPNIGFAWRSGLMTAARMKSYTYLTDWVTLIENPQINLISLQYGDVEQDLKELEDQTRSSLIVPEIDLKNNFEELAAIIKNCDLVFGPSTAPVIQAEVQGVDTIMYELKGLDRWSFGLDMHNSEYKSFWYSNCTNINFSIGNKSELVSRISKMINRTFDLIEET